MAKKRDILLTVLFCGFIGTMAALTAFLPKQEVSVNEKRTLAKFPEFSVQKLFNGKWEKDFETYKIQMILYSLMIEEIYNTKVNKFFLVYLRSKNLIKEYALNDKDRKKHEKYIKDYKTVIGGYYPKATSSKARCVDCCYRNICEK